MGAKRRIAVVTGSRADYGLWYYILRELQSREDVELQLVVTGMHLAPEFGLTVREIEGDGFPVAARVEMLLSGDTGASAARSAGLAVIGMTQAFESLEPDLVLLLGDRTEILAAATVAVHMNIPIGHIHGGESTEGAIDEAIRHAVTKMAHLHFASTQVYAHRICQMGEASWRVHVTGAPGLDHLFRTPRLTPEELETRLGIDFRRPVILATYHPATIERGRAASQVHELLRALEVLELPVLFTAPNADPGGREIRSILQQHVRQSPHLHLVTTLGSQLYFSVMAACAVMVGNSSSGIIEAPSLGLPVVNVGTRQAGRIRAGNVIDVGTTTDEILAGLKIGLFDEEFRKRAANGDNPYGDGHASERIADVLASVALGQELLRKQLAF